MNPYFLLLFFLFSCRIVQAQDIEPKTQIEQEGFGIKGGMIFSNLSPNAGNPLRISYQAGILSQLKLTGKNFGQIELLFSKEGQGPTKTGVVLYNILIPVLYKRNINHWLALEIGPQLNANINRVFDSWRVDNTFWLNADIGLSAYLTNRNYINFRYSRALQPVFTDPNYSTRGFAVTITNIF